MKLKGIILQNNEAQLYPVLSEMRIKRIGVNGHNPVIELSTDFPEIIATPAPIEIKMDNPNGGKVTAKIQAVTKEGKEWGVSRFITFLIEHPQQFAASGLTSSGWITVLDTDIPFEDGPGVLAWLPGIQTDHKQKIREMFPERENEPAYETARRVLLQIRENLKDHLGTPNDQMQRSDPLEQYRMALAGESRAQCNNIVNIFVYFCWALGIPARRINLWQGGLWPPKFVKKAGYNLQTAPGHTTTEIYSYELGRWIWLDPMYNLTGAWIGREDRHGSLLTLTELRHAIQHPPAIGTLQILGTFDDKNHVDFLVWPDANTWTNYLNGTQRITYVIP